MARLIAHASADERIGSIMRTPSTRSRRNGGRSRSARRIICSAGTDIDVRAAKTGFISKSGYCLATLLRLPQGGQEVAVVVLGARSNAGRFLETENLFNWLSAKASTIFATQTDRPSRSRTKPEFVSTRRSPSASLPHRAAASRSYPPPPSPAATRCARRTPSDTCGTRRTRRPGSARRASQTT